MFQKSMKIVVIGSNVKRKAGPRVGSQGYILNIDKAQRTAHIPEMTVCSAKALFTRFGFEKQTRFEKVAVIIVAPDIQSGNNPRKAVNKAIRNIQKTPLTHAILAAPAVENILDPQEVCAKIMCKVCSQPFIRISHNICSPFASPDLGDLTKLNEVLPQHVKKFMLEMTQCSKMSQLRDVIEARYFLKPREIGELFNIVNICEILDHKARTRIKYKPTYYGVNRVKIMGALFNIHEFNALTTRPNKAQQATLREEYSKLVLEVQNKGSLIINKHT